MLLGAHAHTVVAGVASGKLGQFGLPSPHFWRVAEVFSRHGNEFWPGSHGTNSTKHAPCVLGSEADVLKAYGESFARPWRSKLAGDPQSLDPKLGNC